MALDLTLLEFRLLLRVISAVGCDQVVHTVDDVVEVLSSDRGEIDYPHNRNNEHYLGEGFHDRLPLKTKRVNDPSKWLKPSMFQRCVRYALACRAKSDLPRTLLV